LWNPTEPTEVGGYLFAPGTQLAASILLVQLDPELYPPDPQAFRPERFLEGAPEPYAGRLRAGSLQISEDRSPCCPWTSIAGSKSLCCARAIVGRVRLATTSFGGRRRRYAFVIAECSAA